jgi:hypothetical protein
MLGHLYSVKTDTRDRLSSTSTALFKPGVTYTATLELGIKKYFLKEVDT